jgi:hypothetical protein
MLFVSNWARRGSETRRRRRRDGVVRDEARTRAIIPLGFDVTVIGLVTSAYCYGARTSWRALDRTSGLLVSLQVAS